jgi:uroporphyrin-3 C-methyltransferase
VNDLSLEVTTPTQPAAPAAAPSSPLWWWVGAGLLALASLLSLSLAWKAQRHVGALEQELVRRQQNSQSQAEQAQLLAKQAQESVLDAAAKVALLEARVAEVAVQRTQLEELIQSLSRSRDENVLVDIESGIRVAVQQGAITGSAEPLVAVLKQSEERLARYNQPRLQGVRRAIARDLERVKTVGTTDISLLAVKLDEAVRLVDELPLLSSAEPRKDMSAEKAPTTSAPASAASAGTASWLDTSRSAAGRIWGEFRSLVRVTRIDHPEAMLVAPEQAFFLRENLKLRLLNARLALLSRQFDTAQADLQMAQQTMDRYFERNSRRATQAADAIRLVATQARGVSLPRPDDTLAALAAAGAVR